MIFKKLLAIISVMGLFLFTSCDPTSQNPEIQGMIGPKVELTDQYMKVETIFENVQTTGFGRFTFPSLGMPEYPNSYLDIAADEQSGGTSLVVYIAIPDVIFGEEGGVTSLDPQMLPDGRPLPGIEGGSMPAIAFQVKDFYDIGFYVNKNLIGIWYPLPELQIGVNNILTFRYYADGNRVGNVSLVGENENQEGSGVLLMLTLDKKMKNYLKKYYKNWKKGK